MEKLKVLEVAGAELKILWRRQYQVPLELRELNITAPLSDFPKSIGQLKHLEKIVISRPHFHSIALETLPEEFCDLCSLKYLEFKGCERLMSLPDSFGKLTNLEHIDLTNASSLQMLPHTFGHLSQLKHLCLWGCTNLTFSKGTLGNIATLEYLELSSCKKLKELSGKKKGCIVRSRCNKIRDDAQEPTPGDEDYGRWCYHSYDDWGVTIHVRMRALPFTRCSSVMVQNVEASASRF